MKMHKKNCANARVADALSALGVKITPRLPEDALYDFVVGYWKSHGRCPSYLESANAVGRAPGSIGHLFNKLVSSGRAIRGKQHGIAGIIPVTK